MNDKKIETVEEHIMKNIKIDGCFVDIEDDTIIIKFCKETVDFDDFFEVEKSDEIVKALLNHPNSLEIVSNTQNNVGEFYIKDNKLNKNYF